VVQVARHSPALGKRLQAARQRTGLTQVEAMQEVRQHGRPSLSESSLQRWEATGSVQLADAIVLARVYGCTLDELAGLQ
jgi:transcriptional regulator with XRE-family HTH domain